ncbi:MAG: SDR family oxidoreductase [Phenylobacterium sp.]|uniref:SDR family NAD(P)-dependent oxidoreductase n=1 Tax=Phenylobacterium sp. TaxID=1871053 RepID=UPI001A5A19C5|nr:SDR family NAD(P)-dependent oxidoreductase [Phenylobacterium sp.]MBL8556180.1 SDR family oxidoreductase [Phenylobacterium sp.]
MSRSFDGRIVVVSGAAIGFGRAIAETFAARGAIVHGCDVRAPELTALAAATGAWTSVVDLTDRNAARAWIAGVEADAGRAVDVLVNNAGGVAGQAHAPIETVSDADWDRVLEINLGAAMALSRACVPGMKAAGAGAIVNIASGAAFKASLTGVQAYCAAKHAVLGLTRQLCHELGPFGIRVNAVAPGFVRSNEAAERQWAGYSPERQRQIVEGVALRRLGAPQDIANAVAFLASDKASFISGEILSVNGGH